MHFGFLVLKFSLWALLIKARCLGTAVHQPRIQKKTTFTGELQSHRWELTVRTDNSQTKWVLNICHSVVWSTILSLPFSPCSAIMKSNPKWHTSIGPVFLTSRSTQTHRPQPWLLPWAATCLNWTAFFWNSTLYSKMPHLTPLQVKMKTHLRHYEKCIAMH